MNSTTNQSLSYRDAGVDIDAGDALVEAIKPFAKRTMREGVQTFRAWFPASAVSAVFSSRT